MWGGSRCGATCHLLPFPPPLCLQSVNGCGCLNGSLILMESGCYYNLNLYCHADGRNQHPIRHSFICLTFKRSAECQCWRCVCVWGGEMRMGAGRQSTLVAVLPDQLCTEGRRGGGELAAASGIPLPRIKTCLQDTRLKGSAASRPHTHIVK